MAICARCGKNIMFVATHEEKKYCRDCYNTIIKEEEEQLRISTKNMWEDLAKVSYDAMVNAKTIIKDPSLIDKCPNKYWIIYDDSIQIKSGIALNNLQKAINLFVIKGWELKDMMINSTVYGASMQVGSTRSRLGGYAVMEKLNP